MAQTEDPGQRVVARGADVPLRLAQSKIARDALVDPRDSDYIPDVAEKGYHVGTVRQPAEPVLMDDGSVKFETIDDLTALIDSRIAARGGKADDSPFRASKFPSYADEVRANDEYQQAHPELYTGRLYEAPADELAAARRGQGAVPPGEPRRVTVSGADSDAPTIRSATRRSTSRRKSSSRRSKPARQVAEATGSETPSE